MVFVLAEFVKGSVFTLLSILKCIGFFSPKIVSTCMTSWVIKKQKKIKGLYYNVVLFLYTVCVPLSRNMFQQNLIFYHF